MSEADRATIELYSDRAEDYASLPIGREDRARLARFIDAIPAGGTALDLGCGAGWAAATMQDAGLSVTAIDATPEMARVAKERHGLTVEVADFSSISALATYDGIWAHFSLLHLPRRVLPGILASLHRALKPGGRFVMGMKLGEGEARDRLGRFYSYYSAQDLRSRLVQAGFSVVGEERFDAPGFEGTVSSCIIMSADA